MKKTPKRNTPALFAKLFGAALIAAAVLVSAVFFIYVRPNRCTPILMYHGVRDDGSSSLFVSPANFSRQMAFLDEKGFSVMTLEDLVKDVKSGISFRPRAVVITFDDGYEDNYINAFPVLYKRGMSATIFLPTAQISRDKGYLTWDQARVMAKGGIDFGAHTRNHAYLPDIKDKEELLGEVEGPRRDIEANLGSPARFFCYPAGAFNEDSKKAVIEAGYEGALSTNRGRSRSNKDVFELNRVKVTDSDMTRPMHFSAKISGYYNVFRKLGGKSKASWEDDKGGSQ
ncbi:MAG: polysaccharide deacetylase family protein [Candidatus Omnitrophica bacterium]|nr:polysaccharide deacetylase family protein [Candidatus Omnitrophota bacterium]